MAIEFFRDGEVDDRFCPFVDGADRSNPTLPHHCCCHVSRWMQAVRRDRRWTEFARKIEREHDLSELALGVGPPASVATRQHDVVKIDRMLA